MNIKKLTVKLPYKYLWLKHINGVDLSQHCARSFVGDYNKYMSTRKYEYSDIYLPKNYKAHYLCGVRHYDDNIHCAMIEKPGEISTFSNEYYDIVLEDGIFIPIKRSYIPVGYQNSDKRPFYSCRNWQFAHWLNNKWTGHDERNEIHENPVKNPVKNNEVVFDIFDM